MEACFMAKRLPLAWGWLLICRLIWDIVRPMMRQNAKRIFVRLAFLPDKPILPLAMLRQASLLPI
jgi:hypothetical protein